MLHLVTWLDSLCEKGVEDFGNQMQPRGYLQQHDLHVTWVHVTVLFRKGRTRTAPMKVKTTSDSVQWKEQLIKMGCSSSKATESVSTGAASQVTPFGFRFDAVFKF